MNAEEENLQTFLEKYASDGLKRELDLEEAVWRTIPPFITALGFIAALLTYLLSHMRSARWEPLELVCLALMGLGLVSAILSGWFLSRAVRGRKHRYPPNETEICDLARKHVEHSRLNNSDGNHAGVALTAVRIFVLEEVAAAASNNHAVNAKKLIARTLAARMLFLSALFTLAAGAIIAVSDSPMLKASESERQEPKSVAPTATPSDAAGTSVGRKGPHDSAEDPLTRPNPNN